MVRSSRLAHDGSTLLPGVSDPGVSRIPRARTACGPCREVRPDRGGVQRTRDAERPRERRAPLGTVQALRDGVQPGTSPGEPPPRVRGEHPVHHDDPQQTVGRRPGAGIRRRSGPVPPPDRGSGAADRTCGSRTRVVGRCRSVAQSPVSAGSVPALSRPLRRARRAADRLRRRARRRSPRGSASLRMSIRQPVSRAASRAFWPSLPMASESWKSGTTTRAVLVRASSTVTDTTFDGDSALPTNVAGSSDQSMMSIFSPASSLITPRTRAPSGRCTRPWG